MASDLASKRSLNYDVPGGWDTVTLGDVVKESKRSLDPREFPNEVFEYYSIPAYQAAERPIQERGSAIGSQKLLVERGTVLFGKLNPRVPKVWRVSGSSPQRKIASTEFIPLEPIDGRIDGEFLYHLSWSDGIMGEAKGLVSGSTPSRQRVDPRSFLALPIPLPPLEEQRAIASVLRAVQQARDTTEKVIAATGEVKRSLMHHLFTYGPVAIGEAESVPLKETDIGALPEHWQVVELGQLIADGPQNGLYKPAADYGDGAMIVRINDFDVDGQVVTTAPNRVRLDDAEVQKYSLRPNDLLFNRVNSLPQLGKVALIGHVSEPLVFESNMMRFTVDSRRILPEFAFRWLCSTVIHTLVVGRAKRAVAQSSINQGDLQTLQCPLPPITEQAAMVQILFAVERKMEAEVQRRHSLESLFDAVLSDLMTGRRRVVQREVG